MIDDALIVMPAFNEAPVLEKTLAELLPVAAHVLVVDDGSEDDTHGIALRAGASSIRLPTNLGYGGALQAGFKYALRKTDFPAIVTFDADGQHDPAYLSALTAPVKEGRADYVLGSRYLGVGEKPGSAMRDLGIRLFAKAASAAAGKRITDPTTGMLAMNREVAGVFVSDLFPQDYPDADVIIMLARMGFRIEEVPVSIRPSRTGKSMHGGVLRPLYYVAKMSLSMANIATRADLARKRKEARIAG